MSAAPELLQHYPEIIDAMPEVFDAHAFIDEFRLRYPAPYNAYVAEYANSGRRAATYAHREISKSLHEFPHLVQYDGTTTSMNIHGYSSKNARWRKGP